MNIRYLLRTRYAFVIISISVFIASIICFYIFLTQLHSDQLPKITKSTANRYPYNDCVGIRAIAFSPDSKILVTGNDCGIIRAWNAETGAGVQCLPAHSATVTGLLFDKSGLCISSGGDGEIKAWNILTGTKAFSLKGKAGVSAIANTSDNSLLAAGSYRLITLWDVKTHKIAKSIEEASDLPLVYPPDTPMALAFSPDSTLIASGGQCGSITVFEISTKKVKFSFPGVGQERICSLAFSPDGKYLVSTNNYGDVTVRAASSGDLVANLKSGEGSGNSFVSFCKNKNCISAGSSAGKISFWKAPEILSKRDLSPPTTNAQGFWSAAVSPDGKYLAAGYGYNETKIWDVVNGKLLGKHIGPERTWNINAEFAIPSSP